MFSILVGMTLAANQTTIKVTRELREQIAALARDRGLTQASLIEQALAALLRRERLEAARAAMRGNVDDDYLAETRAWQALSSRTVRDEP